MAKAEVTMLRDISIKRIGCDAKDAVRSGKDTFMARIWGQAVSVKTKEARNGDPYSYLIGTFRATSNEGKNFESEKLFLPGGMLESIEAQLAKSGGNAVQFAYDVFSTVDEKSSTGYSYACKALYKAEVSDPIAGLTEEMEKTNLPTAPKKAAK